MNLNQFMDQQKEKARFHINTQDEGLEDRVDLVLNELNIRMH